MSKIFRLYQGGTNTLMDWSNSANFPYNQNNLDTIEDPNGADVHREITSIPSPFARIDLVKNAFQMVCKKNKRGVVDFDRQDSIFHKMVSDAFDVGEIFFNIDKYEDIEIIVWNIQDAIELRDSKKKKGHKYLGDALEKYLSAPSDQKAYNFDLMENIYLLNYKKGPDQMNIIGATSPATMFFGNSNDLSYVTDAIAFNQDKPFDGDLNPLYKRDFEYVKFWFAYRKAFEITTSNGITKHFADVFPELDEYLSQTYRLLPDEKKAVIQEMDSTALDEFTEFSFTSSERTYTAEVLSFPLRKCISLDGVDALTKCEFILKPTKAADGIVVLPVESGNKYSDLYYISGLWGNENHAPFEEKLPFDQRRLPGNGSQIPYITISDLLEDTIIKVGHKINSEEYFDGGLKNDKESFLLPIKPLFFKYFNTSDLTSTLVSGKKMFELSNLAGGGAKVILRIPIVGNNKVKYIEYSRIYVSGGKDITTNKGDVSEWNLAAFLMPNLKFENPLESLYKVGCYSSNLSMSFYNGDMALSVQSVERNSIEKNASKTKIYTIEKKGFEYISVSDSNNQGLIIPLFKQQQSLKTFRFAVDLGTSNTHIEWAYPSDEVSTPFGYTKNDCPISQVYLPSLMTFEGKQFEAGLEKEKEIFEKDFLPAEMNSNVDFKFPTRTVLSHSINIDWRNSNKPFELFNIPFTYQKRSRLPYNEFDSDIKWGDTTDNTKLEAYIENLMLIIRNKVAMNNGVIGNTQIVWSYPISLGGVRFNDFEDKWNEAYAKYFGSGKTTKITESVAPILYLFNEHRRAVNLINIDMGGGTTDIAFSKNKEVNYVTSFKFATNSLFEDTYAKGNQNNAIIDTYKDIILEALGGVESSMVQGINELKQELMNMKDPVETASFLFALSSNSLTKSLNSNYIDFNKLLRADGNFKIVFLIYYAAIIYHVAKIVKLNDIDMPRHISFSGNGSKILKVLGSPKILAEFTKEIIKHAMCTDNYDEELEILGLDGSDSKEATCKGALEALSMINSGATINSPKKIIAKADGTGLIGNANYSSVTSNDYKKGVIKAVEDFLDTILNEIPKSYSYEENFGITLQALENARNISHKPLKDYLDKGFALRIGTNKSEYTSVEETAFFYPIKGLLNDLSDSIIK